MMQRSTVTEGFKAAFKQKTFMLMVIQIREPVKVMEDWGDVC